MQFERERFDLRKMTSNVMFLFDGTASKRHLDISSNINTGDVNHFYGDEVRIRQILNNLVSNAIKFTEIGYVTLNINYERPADGNNHEVVFSVIDTGIGVPDNLQENIFHAFTQADVSTTRKYGGTGLGLSISHKLCKLMGGEMWLESKEGVGSTFYLRLPLEIADADDDEVVDIEVNNTERTVDFSSWNVLVAEDNATNQGIIRMLLIGLGITCDIVDNGQLAVNALDKKHYDIVLMDIQMPVMGGVEATQQIIDKKGADRPLIIAMTANVLSEQREQYANVGMDKFIAKPMSKKSLYDVLSGCVIEKDDEPPKPELISHEETITEDKPVCVLLIDDNKLEHLIADGALKEGAWHLESAYSGEEGLDLLATITPDIILVDNRMPGIDGMEVIRRIRAMDDFVHTPVFLCTGADPTRDIKDELVELGSEYFPKNELSGDKFVARLEKILWHPATLNENRQAGNWS